MKKVILRFSLALALSFGVKAGIAQQEDAQTNGGEQAVEAVIEDATVTEAVAEKTAVASVVVKKAVMTEKEVMAASALSEVWFTYLSGPYNDPNSYSFLTAIDNVAEAECETGSEEICAIKVTQDSGTGKPETSALLLFQSQISAALALEDHTTNVRLRDEEPKN